MRGPHKLEDDVRAAAAGALQHLFHEGRVVHGLRAEPANGGRGLVGANASEDARAQGPADLDGRAPDPARGAVHEQRLAHGQAGLRADRVVCRDERLRDGRGVALVERVWDPGERTLVDDDAVGEPTPADEAEDMLAGLPRRDSVAAGLHDPAYLEARDVGRAARRGRVVALALLHVGRIKRGEAGAHENVLAPEGGIGALLEPDDFVAARAGEDDRPHPASCPTSGRR